MVLNLSIRWKSLPEKGECFERINENLENSFADENFWGGLQSIIVCYTHNHM